MTTTTHDLWRVMDKWKVTIVYLVVVTTAILGASLYDAVYQDARIVRCAETSTTECTNPAPGDGPAQPYPRDNTDDPQESDRG